MVSNLIGFFVGFFARDVVVFFLRAITALLRAQTELLRERK